MKSTKTSKSKSISKSTSKVATKSATRTTSARSLKPTAKTTSKSVVKPTAKVVSKPIAKTISKPVSKTASKTNSSASTKTVKSVESGIKILNDAIKNKTSVSEAARQNGFGRNYVSDIKARIDKNFKNKSINRELYTTFKTSSKSYDKTQK